MGVMGSLWGLWDPYGVFPVADISVSLLLWDPYWVMGSLLGYGIPMGIKGSLWGYGLPMGFMGSLWGL